ncbi:MAG: DNA-binding response regulator [Desulfovibrionaceae bacterium]
MEGSNSAAPQAVGVKSASRILLVDDDRSFRLFLRDFLEEIGFLVVEAEDGLSGVEAFRKEKPEALLVDLRMPALDGLEVLDAVVQEAPEIPVIIISGAGDMDDAIQSLRRGAWDYIIKSPKATETLAEVLGKALEQSRQLQAAGYYQEHLEQQVQERREELVVFRRRLEEEMDERRRAEEMLSSERAQVEDMTTALKKVISTVDQDKQEIKDSLAARIEDEILPALARMAKEPSRRIRETYRKVILDMLVGLTDGARRELDSDLLQLTPTELDVCQYIKANRSTSEIADLMNLSFETIQTHRKHIRKKLGLVNRRISLQSFLKSKRNL